MYAPWIYPMWSHVCHTVGTQDCCSLTIKQQIKILSSVCHWRVPPELASIQHDRLIGGCLDISGHPWDHAMLSSSVREAGHCPRWSSSLLSYVDLWMFAWCASKLPTITPTLCWIGHRCFLRWFWPWVSGRQTSCGVFWWWYVLHQSSQSQTREHISGPLRWSALHRL